MRLDGLSQWNTPVTPSGIEPATFRLLAQCFNQLRHRVSSQRGMRGINLAKQEACMILEDRGKFLSFHAMKEIEVEL